VATIRSRSDLQAFAETYAPDPDRFPEWFIESRSDLSNSSFRSVIAAQDWVTLDAAIDDIEIEGSDTISNIPDPNT
jgi:hypothetical protein